VLGPPSATARRPAGPGARGARTIGHGGRPGPDRRSHPHRRRRRAHRSDGAPGPVLPAPLGFPGRALESHHSIRLPQGRFEATLASVLPAGTDATNQSELRIGGVTFAGSDDPGVNGAADPLVPGDEDPTRVLIDSAPDFEIWKTSADLSGDPAVLLAGETLRYTITVKNVGTDDASDATLRDQIPVNTTYVPGSTTLNGAAVPDGPGGVAPLSAGILVHAPEDPTPGAMRADPDPAADNVATLVFDVVVDPAVPDGTVIANQALVSAVAGGVVDQPPEVLGADQLPGQPHGDGVALRRAAGDRGDEGHLGAFGDLVVLPSEGLVDGHPEAAQATEVLVALLEGLEEVLDGRPRLEGELLALQPQALPQGCEVENLDIHGAAI